MIIPTIPHAQEVYETRDPVRTLHVVTTLMHNSDSAGFDRVAHEEMMQVVRSLTEMRDHERDGYACFVIHSPDQP